MRVHRELVARVGLAASSILTVWLLAEALCLALGLPDRSPSWERIANATRHTRAGSVALVLYPSNPRGYFKIDLRERATWERYRALGVRDLEHAALRPFAVESQYNRLGWRDREFPPKHADVRRVAVIGDSFTEGFGVEQRDAYPQVLGRLLEASDPGHWEVLNCGRSDTDFPYLLTTLFNGALALDPDVVIYGMVLNDPLENESVRARRPDMLGRQPKRPRPLGALDSRLLAWARDARERGRLSRATVDWYLSLYGDANEPAWTRTQALIATMDRRMRARGGRFLLVLWPLLAGLERSYPFEPVHAAVGRFAMREGLAFHDLLGVLRGRDGATLQVHPLDAHPNEVAQRLAAASLMPLVRLLPDGGLGAQPRSGGSPQGPSAGIHSRREPPDGPARQPLSGK